MLLKEIKDYLFKLDLCDICILRYEYADYHLFEQTFLEFQNESAMEQIKRPKLNICAACLGIFQELDKVAKDIADNSNLPSYECTSLYSSIQIPINLLIRDLAIWIDLLERFPGTIKENKPPCISIKDAYKHLFNKILCEATNRTIELNQNGILVHLFFAHDLDNEEVEKLLAVRPSSLRTICEKRKSKSKSSSNITRNHFEKYYFPSNLDFLEFKKFVSVPPKSTSIPIKLVRFSISGPAIFVAGRYRKLSRDLSQTPWLINGNRMKEDSIQELIFCKICPFFGVSTENTTFMGSGREDIDVRCLGKGRPFALQLLDAKKCTMPVKNAAEMEVYIDMSKKISVQHLQLVKREDLAHIKTGEEEKKKFYRALCVLETPATIDIIRKLDISNSFTVQQKTPLRVLHRRPLLTRPREIYSVKGFIYRGNPKIVVIDIVTQAGAYIKELIHGEFGRTQPSISTILGQKIDIVALDVNAVDLNWPNEVANQF